jgi:hypothetical protein
LRRSAKETGRITDDEARKFGGLRGDHNAFGGYIWRRGDKSQKGVGSLVAILSVAILDGSDRIAPAITLDFETDLVACGQTDEQAWVGNTEDHSHVWHVE